MTFATLCELLMDHEIRLQKNQSSGSLSVNAAVKSFPKKIEASKITSPYPKSELRCQICTRKGHSTLNCYNRLNLTCFQPMHNRKLSPLGPNGSNRSSSNSVNLQTTGEASTWYPDSRVTSHITNSSQHIQHPWSFSGNTCILIANGSPLKINSVGCNNFGNSSNKVFSLQDLLHVNSSSYA